ncbi:DUF3574 domain-containing protein [Pelagibius marinus]|uniref:DUF3574 domain-containing protein n=1 Tax=Pelagibius marinus TaxID=2762760 RepID=UPI00187320E7|nr:DUF3574 domain-containing protein [Pelagibius marinus]
MGTYRAFVVGVFLLALTAGLSGDVRAQGGQSCRAEALPMARVELFFGLQRQDGTLIGEAEWAAFLDQEVTPRFPDGLSVFTARGQWRHDTGRIARETSKMLVILYQPSAESEAAIEEIRAAYKEGFDQESVMRLDSSSCVSF